jgi:hypothetical protein
MQLCKSNVITAVIPNWVIGSKLFAVTCLLCYIHSTVLPLYLSSNYPFLYNREYWHKIVQVHYHNWFRLSPIDQVFPLHHSAFIGKILFFLLPSLFVYLYFTAVHMWIMMFCYL